MPYFLVENFSAGLDVRKHPLTSPAGTLRVATNCHVTPGGEIEKRMAFTQAFDVTGTIGLARGPDGKAIVFGTAASGPSGTYGSVTLAYVKLIPPSGETLVKIVDWDIFASRLYVIAEDNTGALFHFYQDPPPGPGLQGDGIHVANAPGRYCRTYKGKMYTVEGATIYFSTVGDPTDYVTTASGAGFIDTSASDGEADDLHGLEAYYDQLAVFSRHAIQIWTMDTDPSNNTRAQVIRGIGTVSPRSPRQYGAGDVLFLADSGVRSLQARDSSNSGSVSDIGSPIDMYMIELIRDNVESYYHDAVTWLDEISGRFWLVLPDDIWVLSLFPGPRVTAWSRYTPEIPGTGAFEPMEITQIEGSVIVRTSGDDILAFGGTDQNTFDAVEAEVQLPYLDGQRPAHWKMFKGLDVAITGTWTFDVSFDPDNESWSQVATLTKSSFPLQRIPFTGYSPGVFVRAKTTVASRAVLANLAVHYDLSKDD